MWGFGKYFVSMDCNRERSDASVVKVGEFSQGGGI